MGAFDNKENKNKLKKEQEIFYAKQNEKMLTANIKAQQTFNYFWREVYWEYRRVVPAHDLAIVKIPFEQKINEIDEPVIEYMWINQINFDGETISGILMNTPNQLTNISEGDRVSQKINNISDWMFSIQGKTHGGFTIQVLRSNMSEQERKQYDKAWGLDFGDYKTILIAFEQQEYKENLIEHPMSKNMGEKAREFFNENLDSINSIDKNGLNILHREAIAGNKTMIDILLELGADKNVKSNQGKTALDFVKELNWKHIIPAL